MKTGSSACEPLGADDVMPAGPVRITRDIFARLARTYPSPDFAIRFWDDSVWAPDAYHPPRFRIVLHHPGALRRMLLNGSPVALGEAYLAGDFSVEGDLESSFRLADHLTRSTSVLDRVWTVCQLLRLPDSAAVP